MSGAVLTRFHLQTSAESKLVLDGVHEVHLNAGDWILAEDGAFQSIPHQMFVKPSNTTLRLILSFTAEGIAQEPMNGEGIDSRT